MYMNVDWSFEDHNVLVKWLILQGEKHFPPQTLTHTKHVFVL